MIQQNLFQKGVVSDLDNSIVANNSWVFPTQNIRVFNFGGQGYIATQVEGNEIKFELSYGFIAIGNAEYNGVVYIISHNPTTLKGEIGSYPSPNWDAGGGTMVDAYHPLKNLTASLTTPIRLDLSDIAFNFSLSYPIYDEMQIIPSYDNSVDIIFTDFNNNIRIVNSGFKNDWTLNERYILQSKLDSSMSLILQTEGSLSLRLESYVAGSLLYGNYIYFARYVDDDFNKTLYLGESNAVSIFKGSWENVEVQGEVGSLNSDKGITLTISGTDSKYNKIQLAYIRYYSDDTQILLWEVKLIDKYYDISSGPTDCTIYGDEQTIDYTLDELIRLNIQERVCKSINVIDNRLYGANWKKKAANHAYLEQISSKIKLRYKQVAGEGSLMSINADAPSNIRSSKSSLGTNLLESFADPFVVHEDMSYFHGEAYAFGITWKWKNNNVSDVYNNLIGYDHFANGTDYSNPNNNGIYRFPHVGVNGTGNETVSYIQGVGTTDNLYMYKTGIEYDFSDVLVFLNANPIIKAWFEDNIESYAPVRAERNKNLLYQGLTLPGLKGSQGATVTGYCFPTANFEIFPYIYEQTGTGKTRFSSFSVWNGAVDSDVHAGTIDFDRFGFYSPDYLLSANSDIDNGGALYASRLYDVRNYIAITWQDRAMSERFPLNEITIWDGYSIYEQKRATYVSALADIYEITSAYNIPASTGLPNTLNNFVSRSSDWSTKTFTELFTDVGGVTPSSNRDLLSPKYIGCQWNSAGALPDEYAFYRKICNIYKSNPLSSSLSGSNIVTFYNDLQNETYFKIGEYTLLANVSAGLTDTFYKGDCFVQKTYFKQRTWKESIAKCDTSALTTCHLGATNMVMWDAWAVGDYYSTNLNERPYGHGALFAIITENAINSGYRCSNDIETFYPVVANVLGASFAGAHSDYWSVLPDQPSVPMSYSVGCISVPGTESFIMNSGYNKTLSPTPHFPYNKDISYQDETLITRIRYSSRLITGSYINQLRIWDSLSYKDYDTKYGPICAIRQLYNKLISVQQKAINEHIINERETLPTSQGQVLLGTGDILGQNVRRLSDYGSDHNSSIKMSSAGIYGMSSIYQILWRIDLSGSDQGTMYTGVTNLSGGKMISSIVNKYLEFVSVVQDNPLDYVHYGSGLITGYDPKFKEILFTIMHRVGCAYSQTTVDTQIKNTLTLSSSLGSLAKMNEYFSIGDSYYIYYWDTQSDLYLSKLITIEEVGLDTISWYTYSSEYIDSEYLITLLYSHTIVFNEKLDMFIGEYTIHPIMYFTLNNNFYSMCTSVPYDTLKYVHQHNIINYVNEQQSNYSFFYGVQYPYKLSYIVNGASENENSNMINKVFTNSIIESSNETFDSIEYITKNQYSKHDMSVIYERPWIDPEYTEDCWRIPVNVQTSVTVNGFESDSNITGRWMKVIITGTKNVQVFIKNIITNFILSKS